jgi:hypothetical protein
MNRIFSKSAAFLKANKQFLSSNFAFTRRGFASNDFSNASSVKQLVFPAVGAILVGLGAVYAFEGKQNAENASSMTVMKKLKGKDSISAPTCGDIAEDVEENHPTATLPVITNDKLFMAMAPNVPPPIVRNFPAKLIVNMQSIKKRSKLDISDDYEFWTINGGVPGELFFSLFSIGFSFFSFFLSSLDGFLVFCFVFPPL